MVIGQNGKIGVLARYFQSIVRASFQTEREHANATIAIIIALGRIWSAKSVPVPMDIPWVKISGYHASKNLPCMDLAHVDRVTKGNCAIWIMVKVVVPVNFVQARLTVIASIALSAMVSDLRNAEVFVSLNQVSLSRNSNFLRAVSSYLITDIA